MTINQENSEVLKINKNAGIDFVHVSEDTFHVIKEENILLTFSRRFDISIGPHKAVEYRNRRREFLPGRNRSESS